MSRINSNISSMIAQFNLAKNNSNLDTRLQRLATGLRINRGADDPAGLIISQRLRTELEGIKQGIKNSERASNVIATTEGALTGERHAQLDQGAGGGGGQLRCVQR